MGEKNFDFDPEGPEHGRIKKGFKDDFSQADLRKYQDPAGMSVAKLDLGLWYVENRDNVIVFLYFLAFLFGLLSWIFFFYQYGSYVIKDLKVTRVYASEIAKRTLPDYSFYQEREAQALQLYPVQSIMGSANKRDLVSQVNNPNQAHWARFKYHFQNGADKIGWEDGFVLPGESKQLLLLGQDIPANTGGLQLVITNIQWGRINRHVVGDWKRFRDSHLDFKFSNKVFSASESSSLSEKIPINTLSFYVENNSSFNYWNVPLIISLYNYGDLSAVVSYQVNDFESNTDREISFTLPGAMKKVTEVKIVPDLDIMRSDIYKDFSASQGIFR
jgi:hypothetical protein